MKEREVSNFFEDLISEETLEKLPYLLMILMVIGGLILSHYLNN
jgi:hypothetical protein